MKIQTDDYQIAFLPETATVNFQGFLRLNGVEAYQPVMDLLLEAVERSPECTVDLRELEFLNSSGISTLSMFVVKVRDRGDRRLRLVGSNKILWQTRSLKNLKRLMPGLALEFTD